MQSKNQVVRRVQVQSVDITFLARAVIRNLYLIIMCTWIGLLAGFMVSGYMKTPVYQSRAYLIIRSKQDPMEIISDYTITKVAAQYRKTFTGSAMQSRIKELTQNEDIKPNISAEVPKGTNILAVSATAENPMDAFAMVKIATENYTLVSDYYITDYFLEELKAPTVPKEEVNPQGWIKMTLLGALSGWGLSTGIIVLLSYLSNVVKNEKQMDAVIDAERFATLYYERKKGKNRKKGILLKYYNTGFLYTESIRKMASKFSYEAKRKGAKVLMVTSVLENEGKSTVASNLALALAAQNKKVLLIDTDFRHPSLYQLFEKNLSEEQEITEYLNGKSTLQDVMTKEEISGLFYLFGSKSYRDSDILLRSEKMKTMISTVKEQMDYVILDTAPMSVSNDAEVLSHLVDTAMLVVRQGYARIPAINDAIDLLYENDVDVCGCVYNAVETQIIPKIEERGYYYAYGYGYSNNYRYYKK